MNELRGQSVFFPQKQAEQDAQAKQSPTPPFVEQKKARGKTNATVVSRYHDTTIPKHHGTTVSSNHDTMVSLGDDGMIEEVRRAVKQVGKEPATQRLTLEEKQTLRSIEFTYGQQGIITSGNEILRIATNYILRDYQKNGEKSILAKVLRSLNAWYHDTTIPWYRETKQPWCNLAIDSKLNDPSIIDLLTKKSTKKASQPNRREALKNQNIFKLAKPSVTVKPLNFVDSQYDASISNNIYLSISYSLTFANRSREAYGKGNRY